MHPSLFKILKYLHYNDFGKFYYSIVQWKETGDLYGPNPATLSPFGPDRAEQFWNMNPPHFHVLMWPLASLPIEKAYVVWAFANVAVLVLAIIATARAVPVHAGPARWFAGVTLAAASAPVLSWAVTGQVTGLLTGLCTWIWLELRRGRWTSAAVLLGLVISVKPFLAPIGLYLIFRRQWRAVIIAGLSMAAAFAAGVVIFGVQTHRDWLAALGDARWIGAVMNASVYGVVGRTWSADVFVVDSLPQVISGLLAAVVLCAGVFAAWRGRNTDQAILLLLATSLLASPLGWVYYVPILLGPLLALNASGQLRKRTHIAFLGFLIPTFVLWPFSSRLFAFTIGSVYWWSLLWVWATVAIATTTPKDCFTDDRASYNKEDPQNKPQTLDRGPHTHGSGTLGHRFASRESIARRLRRVFYPGLEQ
jgi:hypothetical protein